MMHYSVQPNDQIFVKAMSFCLLVKIWAKILVKM